MKNIFYSLLFLLGFLTSAFAYTKYDSNTGNSYNVNQYGNQTHVDGYNANTGSQWHTDIDNQGNMRGTDKDGNYWTYNDSTGSYINSNGTTCIGRGAARTCS